MLLWPKEQYECPGICRLFDISFVDWLLCLLLLLPLSFDEVQGADPHVLFRAGDTSAGEYESNKP